MNVEARPAYRLVTPRLVLRCWDPRDAPLLKQAVDESREHLRPWMAWAGSEPEALGEYVIRLRRQRSNFDRDEDFVYGILDRAETRVLGGAGLHTRVGAGGLEIGYWIHADHVGQGLATEASAALTRAAFDAHGVGRVEIHCHPENARSAAVPRKLGFTLQTEPCRRQAFHAGVWEDATVWRLLAEDYPGSPAARAPAEAFDAVGARIF
jgi:RimJ/RimL family protein N-acetyltransferase